MRKRIILITVGFVAALLIAAGGVYAYDTSRSKVIAAGVTVGGVDLSGLTASEARAKLQREVLEPLNRPIVARHKGRRFRLTPEQARVGVDIDGTVTTALDRSREGNVLVRTVRNLTGGEVNAAIPMDVRYAKPAVNRLVARVRKAVEKPAVDASVDLENGDVAPQASKDGRQVRATTLRRSVERALVDPDAARTLRVRTRTVQPEVTTDELAEKYPAIVIVNRSTFRLQLYRNLELSKTYTIAVGKAGVETPAGLYNIQNKAVNPSWHVPNSDWAGELAGTVVPPGPDNPIKARWMGIYDGAGIHGTTETGSLGSRASHGCLRMAIPDVVELYDDVPVGAPVYIA